MSDDGYYAYSPYDELEDMLYDADPSPDLAEDLAEHTAPSPVYYDEPGGELLNYHSDWDYYSDDFYDDDPALTKDSAVLDGARFNGDKRRSVSAKQIKRGRKRKLAEIEDVAAIDLGERKTLLDCLKGTVWARPTLEDGPVYCEGQQEKVALLKNWKDRWGISLQNDKVEGHKQLQRDESWANEMSLADMGLQNARSHSLAETTDEKTGEQAFDEEEEDYEDGGGEDGEVQDQDLLEASVQNSVRDDGPPTNGENFTVSATKTASRQQAPFPKVSPQDISASESTEHPQKRVRTTLPLSTPALHQISIPLTKHPDKANNQAMNMGPGKRKEIDENQELDASIINQNSASIPNIRKRKASPDLEEAKEKMESQNNTKVKRIASRKGPKVESMAKPSGSLRRGPDRSKKN